MPLMSIHQLEGSSLMPQARHGIRTDCSACPASVRSRRRGHGRQRQRQATTGVERQGCGPE
eukprot:6172927-Amphidinium_carterae.1